MNRETGPLKCLEDLRREVSSIDQSQFRKSLTTDHDAVTS